MVNYCGWSLGNMLASWNMLALGNHNDGQDHSSGLLLLTSHGWDNTLTHFHQSDITLIKQLLLWPQIDKYRKIVKLGVTVRQKSPKVSKLTLLGYSNMLPV